MPKKAPPEVIIEPLLDRDIRRISPAIDIIDGKGAVGVWIPCSITTKTEDNTQQRIDYMPYFVTDDKKLILIDERLWKKGYVLASEPVPIEPRWAICDIRDYLTDGGTLSATEIFQEVLSQWVEYIEFTDEREYIFRTLWDIGTYFHHLFNAYIYDYLGGVKQTGKTKVLTLHSCIAFNAVNSGNLSTASVFRLVQNGRCTLLIDETEMLRAEGRNVPERAYEIRNLLLSGYKKGSYVYRCEKTGKDRIVPEKFEVYGPKALANIRGLEGVLEDRCKVTIMQRARGEKRNREIDIADPKWAKLRDKLYRFYLGNWKRVSEIYASLGGVDSELTEGCELGGREGELWKPILTMALLFNECSECNVMYKTLGIPPSSQRSFSSLTTLILELAKESTRLKKTEDVAEVGENILVKVLANRVRDDDYYKVKDLKQEMGLFYDEQQLWLTTRWIGNALRRLGFREKRRLGTGYEYLIKVQQVHDLVDRLGISTEEIQPKIEKIEDEKKQAKICDVCGMPATVTSGDRRFCDKCARDFKGDL